MLSGDIDTGRQTYAHDKTYYPHVFFSEYQKNDGNDNELEKIFSNYNKINDTLTKQIIQRGAPDNFSFVIIAKNS